jgi:hypothetical protein
METTSTPKSRPHKLQAAYLKQIAQIGPFVEGTLSEYKRAGRKASSWHLTFKVEGKTKTVYVPVDMLEEVREWTEEYRRLKELIRKESKQSLAIIRRHVARRRAASRSAASTRS